MVVGVWVTVAVTVGVGVGLGCKLHKPLDPSTTFPPEPISITTVPSE